jgi:hypothetical protein
MVFGVELVPLDPQEVLDLRELLDLLDLREPREPRDPLVLRDLQGLLEPLQRLLLLKAEVESHHHRIQTIKVAIHQELQIQTLVHCLVVTSGAQLPMLAFVSVMQLNSPLSHHVLSYQKLNMVQAPATL